MLEDPEEIITEIMDLSWDNCEDIETLEEMDQILKQIYGLSYNEYSQIRNDLLVKHDYKLPMSILQSAILNNVTIKLVSDGMLKIGDDMNFIISDKGIQTLNERRVK
jgi:hypothetical protein